MAKTRKVSKIKVKKKRWFPILAPKFLGQKEIGESYLVEAQSAMKRVLKINLRDLTGNIRDQNIYVSLRINEIGGSNLHTEIVGYAYMPFFIKKLIRARSGKVNDSFVLMTKDNKNVRLKPLVITVFPIKKSVKTSIRKKIEKILREEAGKSGFDGLINDLLRYRLQMECKKKLSKICPVREVIMRVAKLEKRRRAGVEKESVEVKEPVEKAKAEVKEPVEKVKEEKK
jgi:small subunit ribosomal protein S3Ae